MDPVVAGADDPPSSLPSMLCLRRFFHTPTILWLPAMPWPLSKQIKDHIFLLNGLVPVNSKPFWSPIKLWAPLLGFPNGTARISIKMHDLLPPRYALLRLTKYDVSLA
ncbi:hypothetical protein VNO78_20126 [Psophocarpus tetragonolobus]|uniref:Uncharacterized protein n=1 Tax=Psophocarpus tetragonolobus TaxID=3891 RepID=A0AAN9SE01_PSOTE